MNFPLNQAIRELVGCVMVVSAILAVEIMLHLASGPIWVCRWLHKPMRALHGDRWARGAQFSGCAAILPRQRCCTLVREIANGQDNFSSVGEEQLPRRGSMLRAGAGPEFFERGCQDSGQRKRFPELTG